MLLSLVTMLYTMYERPTVLDHTGEVWFEIFRTFIGIRANRSDDSFYF